MEWLGLVNLVGECPHQEEGGEPVSMQNMHGSLGMSMSDIVVEEVEEEEDALVLSICTIGNMLNLEVVGKE